MVKCPHKEKSVSFDEIDDFHTNRIMKQKLSYVVKYVLNVFMLDKLRSVLSLEKEDSYTLIRKSINGRMAICFLRKAGRDIFTS